LILGKLFDDKIEAVLGILHSNCINFRRSNSAFVDSRFQNPTIVKEEDITVKGSNNRFWQCLAMMPEQVVPQLQ
jgi:undecaprenyl-diphosphatase